MRAIFCESYGPPSVLHPSTLPTPHARRGEVLLRVLAAEVTKSDCELRAMKFSLKWFAVPLRLMFGWRKPKNPVLGSYLCGEVLGLGADVEAWRLGDVVFGSTHLHMGAYAEYVTVPARAVFASKPRNLDPFQAASVVLGAFNALHFMRQARIQPGQRVLIVGAGGSIGLFALQLAKHWGAQVTAVDASHKFDLLRSLGADRVIDHRQEDPLAAAGQYDVIFSTIAANHYDRCLRALRPGGCFLTANPRLADLVRSGLTNWRGTWRVVTSFAAESRAELEQIRELLEAGALRPVVDRVFPLERVVEAHQRVETEQRIGCVVLDVAGAA